MPVTPDSLAAVDGHWAVESVDIETREIAFNGASIRVVASAVGEQFDLLEANSDALGDPFGSSLGHLASAYEVASIEKFSALFSDYEGERPDKNFAQAGASRAFELLRTLPLPDSFERRVFHVLHLASLAYCSDRWTELRGWLREHDSQIAPEFEHDGSWESQLLTSIYDCWLRLLRKRDWEDVDQIAGLIADLRRDQADLEPEALGGDDISRGHTALRLVAMYHWAKASEMLATYFLQGEPRTIQVELDRHFDAAIRAAGAAHDARLEVLLRWLHVAGRQMSANALWRIADLGDSRITRFIETGARRGMFEFLPPQRVAIAEQGLLDPAHLAVVVDLPTSGGKTLLAELRMMQALNVFRDEHAWVAYVAPTRALVSQLTRRLRRDLGPVGVRVEQLTPAVDLDAFEEALLKGPEDPQNAFDVLVLTPEKLDLLVRGKRIERKLCLVVLDEAHNIEDAERGLGIELLLANVQRDHQEARFLLMMPHVDNAADLAAWLGADRGKSVSLGTTAWQPNDRVVGMFWPQEEPGRGDWSMRFKSLVTAPGSMRVPGESKVGETRPIARSKSQMSALGIQAAAMSKVMSDRGTSIAMAQTIPNCWTMAREVAEKLAPIDSPRLMLVRKFLADEISPDFELIELLGRGVGVHHTGLSDDTKSLIEWLAETGELKVLCATPGIAQGINFPVSSLFIGSLSLPGMGAGRMPKRTFWNLAGRAGRVDQDPVGVVGIAAGDSPESITKFVSEATESLVSRLAVLLREIDEAGRLAQLPALIHGEQWDDFRSYVAHLWNTHQDLEAVLAESEALLRSTFGFSRLRASANPSDRRRADALLTATVQYAAELSEHPENATLTDSTGFAPEGVRTAILEMQKVETPLDAGAWSPESLFGGTGESALPELIGVMLRIPQLANLTELERDGLRRSEIARLTSDWVAGKSIDEIARAYFDAEADLTAAITRTCKAIYRTIGYAATWGISALSKMPGAGIDFDELSDSELRAINNLPAMLYHGVSTESGVLMRINSAPRAVAEALGEKFTATYGDIPVGNQIEASREYLQGLRDEDWEGVRPSNSPMTGADYKTLWSLLSSGSEPTAET